MKKILSVVLATAIIGSYSSNAIAAPGGQSGQDGTKGYPVDPGSPDHFANQPGNSAGNSYAGGILYHNNTDQCALYLQNPWIPHELVPCWAESQENDKNQ